MKPQSLLLDTIIPFKEFFFPPLCFSCNARLSAGESRVCGACWRSIRRVGRDDYTVRVLKDRFAAEGSIDEFYSAYYFEEQGVFQRLVHSLKYEAITKFGIELGVRLGKYLKEEVDVRRIDAIIPIPLHRMKLRERGYNQSESICKGISTVIERPVDLALLQRSKNTVSQTHLTADARRINVGDAFEVRNREKSLPGNSTMLIVDDVITTGSTIEAVARILKHAGAQRVIAASAALAMLGDGGSAK
jgi:ComF family protein